MVKHGAEPAESNYQWWTHSVQSGTLEHSGEQLAVEKMEKARWHSEKSPWEYIWVNYNDLTASPGIMVNKIRGIIPFYGRTIQVSEIL